MTSVNMSLDDIIANYKVKGRGKHTEMRSTKSTSSPKRKTFGKTRWNQIGKGRGNQASNIDGKWKHDLYEKQNSPKPRKSFATKTVVVQTVPALPKKCFLLISNLPLDIVDADLEEMFADFNYTSVQVHYSAAGVSLGTGDVHFLRQADAKAAQERYKDAMLDGELVKMTLVAERPDVGSIASRLTIPAANRKSPKGSFAVKKTIAKAISPSSSRFKTSKSFSPSFKNKNKKSFMRNNDTKRDADGGGFLDRLADDADYQKETTKKRTLEQLDQDLEDYMSKGLKMKSSKTKMDMEVE